MNDPIVAPPGATVSITADRTTDQLPENFAFVMNVSKLGHPGGFALAAGHQLRRANAAEIAVIETSLHNRIMGPVVGPLIWRQRVSSGGQWETLPEGEWRYFVIAFRGMNQTIEELASVFSIAPLELKIGFTAMFDFGADHSQPALISQPSRLFHDLQAASWGQLKLVEVNASDVDEITTLLTRFRQHDNSVLDVRRYTSGIQALQALPPYSPLTFLGYFGLLESLLTHQPDPKDPLDSITRQVKKKVALLDNRFQRRLDYSPFAPATPDKIWTKMYEYRSRLAHGGAPNFEGSIAALGDDKKTLELINQTVKAAVRHALQEPQLIVDLRNC
jgi:hypothetical protein